MPSIQTASGRLVDVFCPEQDDIDIHDIAHALSHLCRFNGHSQFFYSVAQHSAAMAHFLKHEEGVTDNKILLTALLHDAAEAYLGDIPTPLKTQEQRSNEWLLWTKIAQAFGLPEEIPQIVKDADVRMLATERRDVLGPCSKPWNYPPKLPPYAERLLPWSIDAARSLFLEWFFELTETVTVQTLGSPHRVLRVVAKHSTLTQLLESPRCICGFGEYAHYKAPELHLPECPFTKPPVAGMM